MPFEVISHEAPRSYGLENATPFTLLGHRLNFGWAVRAKLYQMMIPRLRDKNGTTPERLFEQYARRLRRRGIVGRSAATVVELLLEEMTEHARKLAPAMRPLIPADEFAIIDAGERSGDLAQALENLLEQRRRTANIVKANRKVALLLLAFIGLFGGTFWIIGKFAIPSLLPFAHAFSKRQTGSQQTLLAVTGWVTGTGPLWVISGVIVVCAVVFWSFRRLTGPLRLALEKIPPWSTYRAIEGYIWLSTYIILVRAGAPETSVLEDQMKTASPWLRERLSKLAELMGQHAYLFPVALEESGFQFPSPDMIDDIANAWGGSTDGYDRLLASSKLWADDIEQAAIQRTEWLRTIGFTVMWIIAGALTFATDTFIPLDQF
ncbi:pilus biosynthesis protein PilR [Gluconobacter thailandicus]|uniref:hypothetical protein n=1 Tax=Gluconobacter thailandicus TaxID=257438 RepID=UPI0007780074|nr:hypothetical protein [Gluconobacter thailandicus]KXV34248.1 pilus biosynthesis protein PilR [Gluconobacter thailandicus]